MTEWIPVSERLPEPGKPVYLRCRDGLELYDTPFLCEYRLPGGSFYNYKTDIKVISKVIHWKEPAPPEQPIPAFLKKQGA